MISHAKQGKKVCKTTASSSHLFCLIQHKYMTKNCSPMLSMVFRFLLATANWLQKKKNTYGGLLLTAADRSNRRQNSIDIWQRMCDILPYICFLLFLPQALSLLFSCMYFKICIFTFNLALFILEFWPTPSKNYLRIEPSPSEETVVKEDKQNSIIMPANPSPESYATFPRSSH